MSSDWGGITAQKPLVAPKTDASAEPDWSLTPENLEGMNNFAGEMPWDTLGRLLWGTSEEGGTLGQIPIVGNVARVPGQLVRGGVNLGGWGVPQIVATAANALGNIPAPGSNVGDVPKGQTADQLTNLYTQWGQQYGGINPLDEQKYPNTGDGAIALVNDVHKYNLVTQFMILGAYQKAHDPDAYAQWSQALADAQSRPTPARAGTDLKNYIRSWAVSYADLTSKGTEGLYASIPELAYGGDASLGDDISDALSYLVLLQHGTEEAVSRLSGHKGGLGQWWGFDTSPVNGVDYGARVNELMRTPAEQLTPVEQVVVSGIKSGWTKDHAYNYLEAHGQGFSSEPLTEMIATLADPLMMATLGAGVLANIPAKAVMLERIAAAANTPQSGLRLWRWATGVARSVGVTVAEMRDGPWGPAYKAARIALDPLHILGGGPKGVARTDLLAAAGLKAYTRAMPALDAATARAVRLGIGDLFQKTTGVSAMNRLRDFGQDAIVKDRLATRTATATMEITEDELKQALKEAPQDMVNKATAFIQKGRHFFMSDADKEQLASRMAVWTGRSVKDMREQVAEMSMDEQAAWHQATYTQAFEDYTEAVNRVDPSLWGSFAKHLGDMVPLNPNVLDKMAANDLIEELRAATGKAAVAIWNRACDQYPDVLEYGRVQGATELEAKVARLERAVKSGGLHVALTDKAIAKLPEQFRHEFLDRWVDAEGKPLWRLGYKPAVDQSSGLVYNGVEYEQKWAPTVGHVTEAIQPSRGVLRTLTDPLGRVIPASIRESRVARGVERVTDAMDAVNRVARDQITSARLMNTMEQKFSRTLQEAGYPAGFSSRLFSLERNWSREHTFTLAGLSEDDFWAAGEAELKNVVDEKIGKRVLYQALIDAAGGDVRTLGLSSWTTQRIRSELVARGLDPNNFLGAVTVKTYNQLRYALNPLFFLQQEFDAPWFNMLRGVMPDLLGRAPKEGSATYQGLQLMKLMGETGMNRDLMMDYTERSMNIGFQKELRDALLTTPGYKATLMERIKGRVGQMVLNNEANYINAHLGDMVFDAVKRTQKNIEGRLAAATTDAERAQWQIARNDPAIMLENIREMETARLGRYATDNEVGRRYLFELIDNAQLEERTPEQWLKFEAAITDGNFKLPASVGQVQPLPLDFLSQRLEFPNIHNVEDLRAALRAGTYTMDTVKERMGKLLYHPDAIKQIETSILFNWRHYFDGLRGTLGMSRREMAGIEDMFVLAARKLHMTGEEYVSQILPMTSHASTRVSQAVEAARAAVSEPSWVAGEAGKVPETLAELAKGEGATLDARTGQMVVAKKGYQVGYGAHPSSTVLEPGFSEDELRAAYEKASASGAPHVGLFRDNSGRLHVEPSETITSKVQAHATGQVRGENYLYDWKAAAEGHEPNLPVRPSYTQEGLDQNIKDTLEVFRLIEKGKAGLPEVTRLATSRFHPSLKNTLLDYFEEQLNGKKGLIAQAIAAGDTTRAADLESIRQALSEGWGPAADDQFRRLILKRIGGEVGEDGGSVRLVPEGFTTNPDEVIGGYNYPLELKRDGIFHVTTASDAVDREGLKSIDEMGVTPEDLMEGKELNTTGFGSKGDTNMIGRTAVSFDRNVANRLLTRMKMSVEVAQGKVSLAEVKAYFEPIYREAYGADGERILAEALGEVVDTPEATYAVMQRLSGMLPGGQGTGLKMTFEHARSLDPDQIALKELAVRRSGGLSLRVGKDFGGGEFDLPTKDLRVISPEADRTIAQADVERGVRYFSEFVQSFPKYQTGAILKDIASHIPVDGAAPYNYTHALLLRVFQENWRLAERDAIRLAYMSSERTVLERSLNHPLLAMYPSSYFFGKVVPETFRFLAMSPFGIDTGAMAEEYYKVQQSIGLQSQYDPGMEQLWNHLGKSAVMALMSYLTPSFPWDDMRSNLPPWVTSLAGGADAWTATKAQMDMMSPERWIKKPVMAAGEVGQMWAANNPFAGQGSSLSGKVQEELNAIGQQPAGQAQPGPVTYQAPTKGVELGSTLEEELRNLEQVLAGR